MATVFAWKHGCTGRWGSLAMRLDNAFYVLALAWAAGNSSQTYGLFFTACLAAMLLGFQALTYGFGLPMVAAFAVPPAVVVWWTRPDTLVTVGAWGEDSAAIGVNGNQRWTL
jgi:hypothetical protein